MVPAWQTAVSAVGATCQWQQERRLPHSRAALCCVGIAIYPHFHGAH